MKIATVTEHIVPAQQLELRLVLPRMQSFIPGVFLPAGVLDLGMILSKVGSSWIILDEDTLRIAV